MRLTAIFIICFVPFLLNAQNNRGHGNDDQMEKDKQRIERLEKIKLIELLDLNDETSMKFFALKNEFENKVRKIGGDKGKLIDDLERDLKSGKKLSDSYVNAQIKRISELDQERVHQRQGYYKSLRKFISSEKIAKYIVFEVRFRDEMWNEMMKKQKK